MPATTSVAVVVSNFPQGEVVEEEQGFGTLNDQVVDAHGNQIDANCLMLSGFNRDLEFGTDAVIRGNQNGIVKTSSLEIEKSAKATKIAVRPRSSCGFHERFDCLNQCVPSINIDPCILVSDR